MRITVDMCNSIDNEVRVKQIIAAAGEACIEFHLGKNIVRRGPSNADITVRVIRQKRM